LLTIEVERPREGVSIISLTGELDLSTTPSLEDGLMDELRSNEGVVVDLRQLTFIDSSGIGLLIKAHRNEGGGAMHTVVSKGSQVDRVCALAGIGKALSIFLQREQALEALEPAGEGNGRPAT